MNRCAAELLMINSRHGASQFGVKEMVFIFSPSPVLPVWPLLAPPQGVPICFGKVGTYFGILRAYMCWYGFSLGS